MRWLRLQSCSGFPLRSLILIAFQWRFWQIVSRTVSHVLKNAEETSKAKKHLPEIVLFNVCKSLEKRSNNRFIDHLRHAVFFQYFSRSFHSIIDFLTIVAVYQRLSTSQSLAYYKVFSKHVVIPPFLCSKLSF